MIFNGWPPQANEGAAGSDFVLLRTARQRWRGQEFVKAVRRFSWSMKGFQMLVLRRSVSEEIIITVGEERIVVKLVDTVGTNHARIGFTASRNVRIDRKEIHDAIQETGFNPEAFPITPLMPVVRIGERLPGELMRRKPQ
jgi:carbon storage regulator CsrA